MKEFPEDTLIHWQKIAPLLTISNEDELEAAIRRVNELLDEDGTNEGHPLYSLLDTLGTLIYAYEEKHNSAEQFRTISDYVLKKNAELYKRLSR
jgi:antitoxin component HigA of HigAB toxin-antitoxin module